MTASIRPDMAGYMGLPLAAWCVGSRPIYPALECQCQCQCQCHWRWEAGGCLSLITRECSRKPVELPGPKREASALRWQLCSYHDCSLLVSELSILRADSQLHRARKQDCDDRWCCSCSDLRTVVAGAVMAGARDPTIRRIRIPTCRTVGADRSDALRGHHHGPCLITVGVQQLRWRQAVEGWVVTMHISVTKRSTGVNSPAGTILIANHCVLSQRFHSARHCSLVGRGLLSRCLSRCVTQQPPHFRQPFHCLESMVDTSCDTNCAVF